MRRRVCGALLVGMASLSLTANAAIPGDVNHDCIVGAADALLLWSAVTGTATLNPEQVDAADVAPVVGGTSAPDGFVNLADLVVLLRAIAGLQALPAGVNIPELGTLPEETGAGYVNVTGKACAGDVVKLYVKTKLRGTATAAADGSFSFPLIGMAYGDNEFKATSTAAGQTSGNSLQQTVDNNQPVITWDAPVLWDDPMLTDDVTVWPPPPEGYYKVNSDFSVPTGKTLIIPPGTIIKFQTGSGNRGFEVTGRLLIQGAPNGKVTLERLVDTAPRWDGIHVTAGSGTLIEYALILRANYPLEVQGATTSATLRESELYDFVQGVTAKAGASVNVTGSDIHYASNSGVGIVIDNAELTVTESDIHRLTSGVKVSHSSFATIGPGNHFWEFRDAAVDMSGLSDGVIIGNEIDASGNPDPPAIDPAQWGINLLNSSPEIRSNVIYGAETGIRVAGGSNPLITDGNEIYSNIWGIWLEGAGEDADELNPDPEQDKIGNPQPIIAGNSIYANSGDRPPTQQPPNNTRDYCSSVGKNLCISDYPPGSNVIVDARGNYWGSNDPNAIRNSILNPDASVYQFGDDDYYYNSESDPIAIDLSNFAESATSGPGTTPLFLSAATGISHSSSLISPTFGGSVTIQFTLATPADVTLRFYAHSDCSLPPCDDAKRTIPMPGLGAGLHTIPWDGKNDSGQFLPDEAYVYILTTTVAGFTDVFNPAAAPFGSRLVHTRLSNGSTSFPTAYNVYRNEPLKILFDVVDARGRVRVNRVPPPPNQNNYVTLANFVAFPQMYRQLFVYDGFGPTGAFIDAQYPMATYWFHPEALQRNAVIVERTAPLIAGPAYQSVRGTAPGGAQPPMIEVKGDPYLVRLSYDQVSRIAFCIDQAAYLTVRILKPGKGDPNVPADVVATLLQDIPGTTPPHDARDCPPAGEDSPYVVEWNGTEPSAGPNVLRPVADGSYTFTIEARNALQSSLRSIYRGIVQTRQ